MLRENGYFLFVLCLVVGVISVSIEFSLLSLEVRFSFDVWGVDFLELDFFVVGSLGEGEGCLLVDGLVIVSFAGVLVTSSDFVSFLGFEEEGFCGREKDVGFFGRSFVEWEGGSNGLLGLYEKVFVDKSHCVDIDTILGLGLLVMLLYVVVFIEG